MGSHFFQKAPTFNSSGTNLEARAVGAPVYAARSAAIGAQKDIGAAQGINKAAYKGPMKRSAAYPKGPKV